MAGGAPGVAPGVAAGAVAPGADRVVVFEHGVVVASGTHDELLASSRVYGELWRAKAESSPATEASVV